MTQRRSLFFSIARLVLATLAFTAVSGGEITATDAVGSCHPTTSGWACARAGDGWAEGNYCEPGQSGGCETCKYTGNSMQSCFYAGGDLHDGWVAEPYDPEGD